MMSSIQRLKARARLVQQVRAFFDARDFVEVDTPLLATSTNTDRHIQSVTCRVNGRTHYLQTSPEFAMKRLLADGCGSIYQICHAFRDEEQGRHHRAEFSLLEWYSLGFDYHRLMDQVEALIADLIPMQKPIRRLSYRQAFIDCLSIDPLDVDRESLIRHVSDIVPGISAAALSKDDCLDLLMSEQVGRQFRGWTFVYDYPASQAALARLSTSDVRVAERFELFYNDLELANGFSELTDSHEQRTRFEQDNVQRLESGLPQYPLDEEFLAALERGLPECAGVALGLDRLLMVMLGEDDIGRVQV